MRVSALFCVCILATGLLTAGPARSQDQQPAQPDDRGSFSILVDNDTFTGTDRHYTNGLRASWLSPEDKLPG